MDTTDLNNEPKKTKITLDSDLATARLFPFMRVDIYSVGAGDENRTRVLNLGSGCTREINVQFIPDQGSYFFDIELTEFIAGTPWALLVIQTHR